MITKWTDHIKDPEDKTKFEQSLRASPILRRLKEILEQQERALQREETSPRSYDNANWAYRQAHANGYKQHLNQMLYLLTLDPEKQ